MSLRRALAHLWAFPVTLFGLIYVGLFATLGWYQYEREVNGALIFSVRMSAPMHLLHLWSAWKGQAIGEVIVLVPTASPSVLVHELDHVRQCRVLGLFQPLIYGLCSLAILLGCPRSSAYRDNIFEREARRAAGQE